MEIAKQVQEINLAQAKQDNKPIEIIDLNVHRVDGAFKSKKIKDCTWEEEIKPKLTLIYSMVGLRSHHYPVGQEKQDLNDYLVLKYGEKTLDELILAFDLAINHELDLKSDEIKVYDQFTISYLANIMSAYKKWLFVTVNNKKTTRIEMTEEKVEVTDEERKEWVNDWVQKEIIDVELIPLLFYEYLNRMGELKINPSNKWEYVAKATTKVKSKLIIEMDTCKTNNTYIAFKEFERMEEHGFTGYMKGRILDMAKRLAIHDYLIDKKISA